MGDVNTAYTALYNKLKALWAGLLVRWRSTGFLAKYAPAGAASNPLRAFTRYNRGYFQRWLLIGTLIGIVAGVGAIVFATAISLSSHLLLGGIAGFTPPQPAGEGPTIITPIAHRWLIPVVTT